MNKKTVFTMSNSIGKIASVYFDADEVSFYPTITSEEEKNSILSLNWHEPESISFHCDLAPYGKYTLLGYSNNYVKMHGGRVPRRKTIKRCLH